MKEFTEQQVDDIIKLKFGKLVTEPGHKQYVGNRVLGQIFGVSHSRIRQLYLARFEKVRISSLPLLQRLQRSAKMQPRKNFGLRFLKPHEIKWLTNNSTLRQQTALSLSDRCSHFRKEFPTANINPTLLR